MRLAQYQRSRTGSGFFIASQRRADADKYY
jgi:hypothetical protein